MSSFVEILISCYLMYVYLHYFNVIGFAFSIYILAVAVTRGERVLPMTFLFISNTTLFLSSFFYFLFVTGNIFQYPHFIRVPAPFHYIGGPCIYLFVKYLLTREKKIQHRDFMHFIPFVLHFIELIPFYLEDTSYKIEIIKQVQNDYSIPFFSLREGLLPSKLHTFFKVISGLTYIILSLRILNKFKKSIKSEIVTDYKRKFDFLNFYLFSKYIAVVGFLTAIIFIKYNPSLVFFTLIANFLGITNVFVLAIKFPEFLYGEMLKGKFDNNREQLMNIVKTQSKNLQVLEITSYEANILIDLNNRVLFFDNLGEVYFKKIFNKDIEIDTDFTAHFDLVTLKSFIAIIDKVANGNQVRFEDKFLLSNGKELIWMELCFMPHYTEKDKLFGISIGAKVIDEKKRMESLQVKYKESLDQLAWSSSHLLRAPVSNISGILQLIADDKIEMSESEKKYLLNNIFSEVNKLDAVIKDMVATARKNLDN